jgi:hypothetical protein
MDDILLNDGLFSLWANRNESDWGTKVVFNKGEIGLATHRELVKGLTMAYILRPTFEFFVDRLATFNFADGGGDIIDFLSIKGIAHADLERRKVG